MSTTRPNLALSPLAAVYALLLARARTQQRQAPGTKNEPVPDRLAPVGTGSDQEAPDHGRSVYTN